MQHSLKTGLSVSEAAWSLGSFRVRTDLTLVLGPSGETWTILLLRTYAGLENKIKCPLNVNETL